MLQPHTVKFYRVKQFLNFSSLFCRPFECVPPLGLVGLVINQLLDMLHLYGMGHIFLFDSNFGNFFFNLNKIQYYNNRKEQ